MEKNDQTELSEHNHEVFQLKQAQSYTEEHFAEDGQYETMAHREQDGILRVLIPRHI